jgi:hypothetical protein
MNTVIALKANFEMENKRLNAEIDRLRQTLDQS